MILIKEDKQLYLSNHEKDGNNMKKWVKIIIILLLAWNLLDLFLGENASSIEQFYYKTFIYGDKMGGVSQTEIKVLPQVILYFLDIKLTNPANGIGTLLILSLVRILPYETDVIWNNYEAFDTLYTVMDFLMMIIAALIAITGIVFLLVAKEKSKWQLRVLGILTVLFVSPVAGAFILASDATKQNKKLPADANV